MNTKLAPTALSPPTLKELERALDEALTALMKHRARKHLDQPTTELNITRASDLEATSLAVLVARDVVVDPINYALKQVLKQIGKLIADQVRTQSEFLEIAERACSRDDANYGRRQSSIDWAFDGIQTRDGLTWWA